jgi:hypothetical protein
MYRPNFCAECGERLARRNWRAWIKVWTGVWARAWWCEECARRLGRFGFTGFVRSVAFVALVSISAFSFGRFLRPAPPPLIISRAANSPLSDLPVNFEETARTVTRNEGDSTDRSAAPSQAADEKAYICGARTKKGTPCRRRVHSAGQRCFQHRGAVAMVPLEKLEVKSK